MTKFINKKLLKTKLVAFGDYGKVPLEVSILGQIDHENIIKLHDIFDNDKYFQMVKNTLPGLLKLKLTKPNF